MQNEEAHIERAIQSVRIPGMDTQPEVIVVDGGSNDKTCSIASRYPGVKVMQVPGGRGAQLNEGLRQLPVVYLCTNVSTERDNESALLWWEVEVV